MKSFWFFVILLCLISGACYLARAYGVDTFTRAESCFSECAREMLETHNYVVPIYYGHSFFDKPILTYWLIAAAYQFLSISVFTARLPSIILALSCVSLVACFAKKIYGNFVGILAGTMLASCTGFYEMACSSMSDMPLCFFEFLSVVAFFLGVKNSNKRMLLFCIASFGIGAGFLTKGLPALAIPLITFVLFLVIYKKTNIIRLSHLLLAALIFMIIVLPWHAALYQQCGIFPLQYIYLHEQIQRFSANISQYNFGHPFYYMAWSMVSQLLPWTFFLPLVIWGLKGDIKERPLAEETQCAVLMLIFILVHLMLFSLSKSNWGYYNLPALPAASILLSRYYSEFFPSGSNLYRKLKVMLPTVIFAGACISSLVIFLFVWPAKLQHEAQCSFANLLAAKYAGARILYHSDLAGQYQLTDLITFKTGQMPEFGDQERMAKYLEQGAQIYAILPEQRFNELPGSLKQTLTVVSAEKFKYIGFPSCKLSIKDAQNHKVGLILVTNELQHH